MRVFVCVHLWFPDFNDPGGWDYDSSVGPQWTWLLNLVQHETRHLVVELREKSPVIYLFIHHCTYEPQTHVKSYFTQMTTYIKTAELRWTVTYSLFTPGTTDGDDFFTMEELLLKTLQEQGEEHSASLYEQ